MTWKQQPATVSPPPPEPTVRIRGRAVLALVLLLPALFVAKFLLLATDRGGRCFVNDFECTPFPFEAFGGLLAAVLVAAVLAIASSPVRVARIALGAQLALEAVAVALVLAFP
ncbi:hypothetical protein OG625_21615 [Streptomyces sp. NBC_01351]|uniref:hypothetical protein n=1 Tax=Streptomyces sp. NBC_01351 TaxID=2903833 RepID=UPI002E3560CA|nr:hypothetical protein [Streptomyces sp. NBC_01351]